MNTFAYALALSLSLSLYRSVRDTKFHFKLVSKLLADKKTSAKVSQSNLWYFAQGLNLNFHCPSSLLCLIFVYIYFYELMAPSNTETHYKMLWRMFPIFATLISTVDFKCSSRFYPRIKYDNWSFHKIYQLFSCIILINFRNFQCGQRMCIDVRFRQFCWSIDFESTHKMLTERKSHKIMMNAVHSSPHTECRYNASTLISFIPQTWAFSNHVELNAISNAPQFLCIANLYDIYCPCSVMLMLLTYIHLIYTRAAGTALRCHRTKLLLTLFGMIVLNKCDTNDWLYTQLDAFLYGCIREKVVVYIHTSPIKWDVYIFHKCQLRTANYFIH